MTGRIDVKAYMDFPKDSDNRTIQGILRRMHPKYQVNGQQEARSAIYWDEESFGLQNVSAFQNASLEKQKAILHGLSLMFLREAFAIERAGMAFAAKMVLLSDDLDARILYSQFGAQEAGHYQMIASHVQGTFQNLDQDPFLGLLKHTIEQADRMTLTFVIQVVLEGWGLLHYRKLQKECLREDLALDLKQILADEAHHHGSGVAFFDESKLTEPGLCLEVLGSLLSMVRVGPVGVLHELQKVLGPLDAERIFAELNHTEVTTQKLQQLRGIMKAAGAPRLLEQLQASFAPLTEQTYA